MQVIQVFFFIDFVIVLINIHTSETYSDALVKMKVVENNQYAFTTESEMEPEEQAAKFENDVKKNHLQQSLEKMKSRINVNPIPDEASKSKLVVEAKGKQIYIVL